MTESRKGLSIKIQSLTAGKFWVAATAASAAVVVVVSSVVVLFLQGSAWWAGWQPVLLAVGATWLIPPIGLLPLLWADRAQPVKMVQAVQLASAVRLGTAAVLALVILLVLSDSRARVAFGVWMTGLYLMSLAAEMCVLVVWLKAGSKGT